MSTPWAVLVSLILLACNSFFVAAEFALVAAKRHRLERAATSGNRAALAALTGARHLSVMLAGAQLGITLCTLGLGAVAKPAVAYGLEPGLTLVGLPLGVADVVAFILAVALVGFLHVVVGEMAPKSWAISHPEDSALLLARPFVTFTRMVGPVLIVLNALANLCLRLVRVHPQDELANAHGPQELRILLDTSREDGTLDTSHHGLLTAMLAIQQITVGQVMTPAAQVVTVPPTAEAHQIERISRTTGRSRLVVSTTGTGAMAMATAMADADAAGGPLGGAGGVGACGAIGIVHVRDAVRVTTRGDRAMASDLMTEAFALPVSVSVAAAVRMMRQARAQLAVVAGPDGALEGVVALEDLLEQLIGEFDDETDPVPAAAGQAPSRR